MQLGQILIESRWQRHKNEFACEAAIESTSSTTRTHHRYAKSAQNKLKAPIYKISQRPYQILEHPQSQNQIKATTWERKYTEQLKLHNGNKPVVTSENKGIQHETRKKVRCTYKIEPR